jgi:hypothetical protein
MGIAFYNGKNMGHMRCTQFNVLRGLLFKVAFNESLDDFYEQLQIGEFQRTDSMTEHPLMPLIHQPDDDGHVMAEHCIPLANEIERLLPDVTIPEGLEGVEQGDYPYLIQQMVKGLKACGKSSMSFTWS